MTRYCRLPAFVVLCGLVISALALPLATSVFAVSTRIKVTVLSKDAKFIGSSMGGARITLEDADTGALLAAGVTTGDTGKTDVIVLNDHERGVALSSQTSGRFLTELNLDRPRRIRFTATGPLAQRQAAATVSAEQWVMPGRHIDKGDGMRLIMPGFAVDILHPPTHIRLGGGAPQTIPVRANVVMMCGCPLQPGGLWDSERYELRALLSRNGREIASLPLRFAGTPSQFEAMVEVDASGWYEVLVYAYDPANGNTGLDRATFAVIP